MSPRPIAPADSVTGPWWDATKAERLLVQKCSKCAHLQHYPRALCTNCGSTELGWMDACGRAEVYSYTQVQRAPSDDFQVPYVVALIKLEEGPVMLTNIVGASKRLSVGSLVEVSWEALEDGRRLPVFKERD